MMYQLLNNRKIIKESKSKENILKEFKKYNNSGKIEIHKIDKENRTITKIKMKIIPELEIYYLIQVTGSEGNIRYKTKNQAELDFENFKKIKPKLLVLYQIKKKKNEENIQKNKIKKKKIKNGEKKQKKKIVEKIYTKKYEKLKKEYDKLKKNPIIKIFIKLLKTTKYE